MMQRQESSINEPEGHASALRSAYDMLALFASVGANAFDLTIITRIGEKVRFQRRTSIEALRQRLPALLPSCTAAQHSLIVRPAMSQSKSVPPPPVLLQLDDLNEAALERALPAAFLGLETSPGNYQAWIASHDDTGGAAVADGKDFARCLRKGVGADPTASGATRIAGSLNFKDKYAPNFPCVRIAHGAPGRIVTREQLIDLGLVAPPAPPAAAETSRIIAPVRVSHRRQDARKWPSYQRCVEQAPLNHAGTGPDISRADFVFCLTAIDWGWGIEETAERLLGESTKARDNGGERYARLTAQNAAAVIEQRRHRSR